jgi:ribonucleotide reductase beta subunit family protein with ferritin-like domain
MDSVDELLSKLTELGFFKFAPPENMEQIIQLIREDIGEKISDDYIDWDLYSDSENDSMIPLDRRIYWADAKDLWKTGVCGFIDDIKPVLELEGVKIESLRDEVQRVGERGFIYSVWVNGQLYLIGDHTLAHPACVAHKKTLEIINDLLAAAGSQERAYGQYFYNEAKISLLTDELYEFIQSLPLPEVARPYRSETMNCQ